MIYLLILFPLAMAALTFGLPSNRWRPWLLPVAGLGQLCLVAAAVFGPGEGSNLSVLGGWLLLDALGKVVLGFLSVLFFLCSLYAPGYLALRADRPNRVFCAYLLAALAMLTLVILSQPLGLMCIGI